MKTIVHALLILVLASGFCVGKPLDSSRRLPWHNSQNDPSQIPRANTPTLKGTQSPDQWSLLQYVGGTAFSFFADVAKRDNYVFTVHTNGLVVYDVAQADAISEVANLFFDDGYCYPLSSTPWAAVEISGDYAYAVNGCQGHPDYPDIAGLFIIDISNPTAPEIIGKFIKPDYTTMDPAYHNLVLRPPYAFCMNYDVGTIDIVDISDPANPQLAGTYQANPEVIGADISGDYLVVGALDEVEIIDISDPTNPQHVGASVHSPPGEVLYGRIGIFGNHIYACRGAVLDIIDMTDPAEPNFVGIYSNDATEFYDIEIYENYAVLTGSNGGRWSPSSVIILDLSDPDHPAKLGQIDSDQGMIGLTVDNDKVYTCGDGIAVIDISSPESPLVAGNFLGGQPHGIVISGDYAYCGTGYDSLIIMDISDPSRLSRVGFTATAGHVSDLAVSGGKLYVSDDGLQIFDVTAPTQPELLSLTPGLSGDIFISGNMLYTNIGDDLVLVDVGDPSNPIIRSQTPLYLPFVCIHVEYPYAFVVDSNFLHVFDVSDADEPVMTGGLSLGEYWPTDISYKDNFIYLNGLSTIIDVTEPSNPIAIDGPISDYMMMDIAGHFLYGLMEYGVICYDISDPYSIFLHSGRYFGEPLILYDAMGIRALGGNIYITTGTAFYVFTDATITDPPHVDINPSRLAFHAVAGGALPVPQSVLVTNGGTGSMTWSASSNQSWLSVSPTSGAGNTADLNISIITTSLDPGQLYTGIITVTSPEADNTAEIAVDYYVTGTITVEGYVYKAKVVPEPLPDAELNFHNQQSANDYPLTAGAEGQYSVDLPPGIYDVSVSKENYESMLEFNLDFQTLHINRDFELWHADSTYLNLSIYFEDQSLVDQDAVATDHLKIRPVLSNNEGRDVDDVGLEFRIDGELQEWDPGDMWDHDPDDGLIDRLYEGDNMVYILDVQVPAMWKNKAITATIASADGWKIRNCSAERDVTVLYLKQSLPYTINHHAYSFRNPGSEMTLAWLQAKDKNILKYIPGPTLITSLGNCFGMAGSSNNYFLTGYPGIVYELALSDPGVASEIIEYQLSQLVSPVVGSDGFCLPRIWQPMNEAIDDLTAAIEGQRTVVLAIQSPQAFAGLIPYMHAISAYKTVIDHDANTQYVFVYDSNEPYPFVPGLDNIMKVDLSGDMSYEYRDYSKVQVCENIQKMSVDEILDGLWAMIRDIPGDLWNAGKRLVSFDCPVRPLIIDETGNRFGYIDDTTWAAEIPSAECSMIPLNDTEFSYAFELPASGSYNVILSSYESGLLSISSIFPKSGSEAVISLFEDIDLSAQSVCSLAVMAGGETIDSVFVDFDGNSSYEDIDYPTTNLPPGSFSLITPTNGAVVHDQVEFAWHSAVDVDWGDALSYHLIISEDSLFSDSIVFDCGSDTSFATSNVSTDIVIYWKVNARDLYEHVQPSRYFNSFVFATYICGDANSDETINIGDAVHLINYIFKGGPAPEPLCVGDGNGDDAINIGDAVHLINYIFKGGPAPVEPCCP